MTGAVTAVARSRTLRALHEPAMPSAREFNDQNEASKQRLSQLKESL
jgi:hypothetical protein